MHRAEAETEPPNVGESDQPDHVRGRFTVENHRGPADITTVPSFPGYQCLAVIGQGGMGVVYKARNTRLGRIVALKTITELEPANPNQFGRFLDEARAAARLQHPNIITVHEIGEHQGRPYFVQEFVDGGDLKKQLADKPMTGARICRATRIPGPGGARRPHGRDCASGLEAQQHPPDIRGSPEGRRFRAGQAPGRGFGAHPVRPGGGDSQLHGA